MSEGEAVRQMIVASVALEMLFCLVAMMWVMKDAKSRGMSGWLVVLLILVFQVPD